MCGRFVLEDPTDVFQTLFDLTPPMSLESRYNIAPTQPILAIRSGANGNEVAPLRWGLVASWAKEMDSHGPLINARAESVAEKPSFRTPFRRRRCLVPAHGYYEWQAVGKRKQPYYIRLDDGRPFAFAGIWEIWESPQGYLESCAIITTEANALTKPLHARMPVILHRDDYAMWLDPSVQRTEPLLALLDPYPSDEMTTYPVSTRVNSVANDDPTCIEPVEPSPSLL